VTAALRRRIAARHRRGTYPKIDDPGEWLLRYWRGASSPRETRRRKMSPAQQAGILAAGRFDASAGLVLTADVGGDPSGQPVLLLHGGGQTRHSWGRAAIELAAQGYYAVALDLRGHGDSDWAADADYTLDAHIADIRAVIRGLSRPPALIGASMGGLISLSVAGESPDLPIRCLVLVDVTPRVDAAGRARILGFMRERPDGFASIEEAADGSASQSAPWRGWALALALGSALFRHLRAGPRNRGATLHGGGEASRGAHTAGARIEERAGDAGQRPTLPRIDSACRVCRCRGRRAHDRRRPQRPVQRGGPGIPAKARSA
jgi:pimeloyl-ACP methyl ester carboxylesterase